MEGDLELMSVLANGLPVSEDLDLVADVERLKVPPLPKRRLLMLVGIFSTGNNFERRMALRRSWMQYEAVRSGDVAVRFITGLVSKLLSVRKHHNIIQGAKTNFLKTEETGLSDSVSAGLVHSRLTRKYQKIA